MKLTGLAISMGIGAAAGAVTAMMLPKQSAAHKMVKKAADAVEDAAANVGDIITQNIDTMYQKDTEARFRVFYLTVHSASRCRFPPRYGWS